MKNSILFAVLGVLCLATMVIAENETLYSYKVTRFPFYAYSDSSTRANNGILAGWMGDLRNLKIDKLCGKNTRSGKSCMRVSYEVRTRTEKRATGVYLQSNPMNYWFDMRGAYDMTRANKVYFYARGEKGSEVVEFKMMKAKEQNPLALSAFSKKITLTSEWKKYELDLKDAALDQISGGFGFIIHTEDNPEGTVFYLDDIYYTSEKDTFEVKAAVNSKMN